MPSKAVSSTRRKVFRAAEAAVWGLIDGTASPSDIRELLRATGDPIKSAYLALSMASRLTDDIELKLREELGRTIDEGQA